MNLEDLLDAVEDGDIEGVEQAIEKDNVDPNGIDEEGFSPLMLAAHCGQGAIGEYLLSKNANVNYVATDGSDALMCAVQGGFEDVCVYLINAGAAINARTPGAFSPLYSAAQEGHLPIVELLLKRKSDPDGKCQGVSPLFIAAQENHHAVVQALLNANCNVNDTNPSLATPLFIAVQKGNTAIVKTLIKKKKKSLDMEACTKQGLSALVVAIKIGHLDETKLLVAGGADINHPTAETGMTPLMTAALYGDIDVVELLVQAGADVAARNKDGDDAATILMREFNEDLNKIVGGKAAVSPSAGARAPPPPPKKKKDKKKNKKHKKHKKGVLDVQSSQALANQAMMRFRRYDTDGSGTLERGELIKCLDDMGCRQQLGDEKFTKLVDYSLSTFDKDNNGRLDFQEYVQLYNKLQATVERVQRRKQAGVVVDDHSIQRRKSVAEMNADGPENNGRELVLPALDAHKKDKHKKKKKKKGIAQRLRRGPGGSAKEGGGPVLHKPGNSGEAAH